MRWRRGSRCRKQVPQLNLLIAQGTNRQPGDNGLVLFDLDRAEARHVPVPEGYATMADSTLFLASRKLVLRGIRQNNAGANLLIYDFSTGDLSIVPTPEGVEPLGPVPGQAPGAGQTPAPTRLLASNTKANTVAAIGHNARGGQAGLVVGRIP